MTERILGLDDWHGNDWTDLDQVGGDVQFCYYRLGFALDKDLSFEKSWAGGKDTWRKGVYYAFSPYYSVDQTKRFIEMHENLYRDATLPFALDVERDDGISKPEIIRKLTELRDWLIQKYGRIVIYTGGWWWNEFIRPIPRWQAEQDFWLAFYPFTTKPKVKLTWENLKNWYPRNWIYPLHGGGRVVLWQWSGDKFLLPGVSGAIDLNFAEPEWWHELGYSEPTILDRVNDLTYRVKAIEAKLAG